MPIGIGGRYNILLPFHKNPETDIYNVLETARKLIPFEEGEYLDKMRDLFLTEGKEGNWHD